MKLMTFSLAAGMAASLILAGGAFASDDEPDYGNPLESEDVEDTPGTVCSNHTLRGDYAFAVEGTLVNGPVQGPLRVVGISHYDGAGHITQLDFGVVNGVPLGPDWREGSGTYQVNANCTGSSVIVPTGGAPPIPLRFVISDRGRLTRAVVIGNPLVAESHRIR